MTQEAARGGLACPQCGCERTYVTDKRASPKRNAVRRRHECGNGRCEHRFTTYETLTTRADLDAVEREKQRLIKELRAMLRAMELHGGPDRR